MTFFDKAVKELYTCSDFHSSLAVFETTIQKLGFQHYFFTQIQTESYPALFKVKYFETSYPEEWIKLYIDEQYFFIDPVAKYLLSSHTPFYWSEEISQVNLSQEQSVMMNNAANHGVVDGVGTSYIKRGGKLFTLSASTDTPIDNYDKTILGQIYLLGTALVTCFEKHHPIQANDTDLTQKEKNIVTTAAVGKTDSEIAQIYNISVNTVRYHWKNIFEKLDSTSRIYAIIKAINLGFIDTDIFELPTESGSSKSYQRSV
jgi:DNA-binding CsgD family transcriptional regulator